MRDRVSSVFRSAAVWVLAWAVFAAILDIALVHRFSTAATPWILLMLCGPAIVGVASIAFAVAGRLGVAVLIPIVLVMAVAAVAAHAVAYLGGGLAMPDAADPAPAPPPIRDAVYFSVVTFTTLGYGDIRPTEEYRLVAAMEALYGYLFLGLLVGLVANAVASARTGSKNPRENGADDGDGGSERH